MEQFNNGTKVCPCEPSCEEEVYPASVSSVTWPSKKYQVTVSNFLSTFQETAANAYGVNKESVSENLIKINVYYTSLNEKAVEDKIDYSFQVRWLTN